MAASSHPAFEIPTIDISPYTDAVPAPRSPDADAAGEARASGASAGAGLARRQRSTAEAFDAAARSVGIAEIVGHGIAPATVAGLAEAMRGFFALPTGEKLALRVDPELNRGYSPPLSEALSKSIGVDSASRSNDNFESFNSGAAASEFAQSNLPTEHYAENIWPASLPQFRAQVSAYYAEAQRVSSALTRVFTDALGLQPEFFDAFNTAPVDTLRLNAYPAPPDGDPVEPSPAGMGAHTDFGLVTILWADRMPGLQVLDRSNTWRDVVAREGALLVLLGDLTARLTNDVWPATLHRVVVRPSAGQGSHRRRSAAFFHDGNIDAVVETLPAFIDAGEHPIYEPITVRENLVSKLRGSRSGQRNYAAAREALRVRDATDPAA
ncbi:isopenicillin N synthase family dioxygenase [Subtercola sp. RTI3]|uniref:isopenicillin N synthase family dioxygenase n=1 Tax=Subtercola sp. RTI3 TaxID=3048639 RepID=UPI002B22CF2C|nr:2-oxoglutarate and iron-dependent oxygenase domain-containing protein [Subtercola sp. RTI3]MEA9985835.1 2-oxoglutarate and iron-dependent oxygenase domain-containing protein [Subtercola sp. RTI3]